MAFITAWQKENETASEKDLRISPSTVNRRNICVFGTTAYPFFQPVLLTWDDNLCLQGNGSGLALKPLEKTISLKRQVFAFIEQEGQNLNLHE